MTQKADRDQIRRQNRSIVLQALRRDGPQARIDLGRTTHLSPATVTSITSDLIEEELIIGIEDKEHKERLTRGRPRSLLALNPAASAVLAVKISVNTIEFALADYSGQVVARDRRKFDSATVTPAGFAVELVDAARRFLEASEATVDGTLLEIAVAAQGVVDSGTGVVIWSPAFETRNIPVVAPLTEAFGAHCMLSNDTNMIAEALHWSQPEHYGGTFAVIFIDYGVGMGLYIDDRLFFGETGAAAEIGHANHIPGGALCRCGKRGCLEAYLGDYAILRAARGLPDTTPPADIAVNTSTISELVAAADAGNARALAAFSVAGRALGFGIARLTAILDPRRIAVTGAGIRGYRFMRSAMEAALEEALVEDLRRGIAIDPIDWEEDLILRGTIAQAMRRFDREVFAEQRPVASGSTRTAAPFAPAAPASR